MLLGNVRQFLTREDAALAVRLVSRGSAAAQDRAETRLREEGIDALLDDPALLEGLVRTPLGSRASYPLLCYVLVRHALRAQDTDDRALSDYVAGILLHFGLRDRAFRIAEADDETYDTLAALVRDAEGQDPRRSFLVRLHLAHYALWMAGLFPDHIAARRHRRGGPDLDYYDELGAHGFRLAAQHRLANEHGVEPLLREAAQRYVALRVALNNVSDTLLFPDRHTPDRLLRQVRDAARWRLAS
jgi:hypothetical protein